MNELLPFIFSGIILGLPSGIAPGPLLTLVITQTLQHNKREGVLVAMVPLIADIPLILVVLLLADRLSDAHIFFGIVALIGGAFVLYLGYETMRTHALVVGEQKASSHSIRKGITVNALNPHPYLFWVTIGTPIILKASEVSIWAPVAFIAAFLVCLVGGKVVVALFVDRMRSFLQGTAYIWTMRVLGLCLILFSITLFKDGLEIFGIL